MIRLASTDLISLITAQNGALVVASYSDATTSAYTGNTQPTSITSATTTTVVSSPAAGTIRDIDELNIKNTYAGSHTITVQFNRSGTLYPIFTASLLTNESISYTHGSGWCALDANGNRKEAYGPVPSSSVLGTTTNDSAGAGYLGEYQVGSQSSNTNFPTTAQYGDLTSVSLTAGDWDVSASINTSLNGATVDGEIRFGISSTSGNSSAGLTTGLNLLAVTPPTATGDSGNSIPCYRVSIASTMTYYLKYIAGYSAGTPQAAGSIHARRVR